MGGAVEGSNGGAEVGSVSRQRPGLAGRVKPRPAAGGGGWRGLPHERVLELDGELAECAKGAAALRLQLGEAFDVLCRRGWQSELGYSSLGAYALQRCRQSGSWAEESRRVAKRLASLPALRAALQAGDVNWSMAEFVSRHATGDNDAELTAEAKGQTVRGMRERLGSNARSGEGAVSGNERSGGEQEPAGEQAEAGDHVGECCEERGGRQAPHGIQESDGGLSTTLSDELVATCAAEGGPWVLGLLSGSDPAELEDQDPMCTLSLTVDREVAWMLEATRTIIELLNGSRSSDEFVECILAEALTSLPDCPPTGLVLDADDADEEQARQRAWLQQCDSWRKEAERLCERNIAALLGLERKGESAERAARSTKQGARRCGAEDCAAAVELDALICRLAVQLTRHDFTIGRLALRMHEVQGWRRLGFASEAQYARERLGVSVSSLRAKRALARRLRTLPVVRGALEAGAIGFDAAQQIARVATEQTERQWVERAKCRTAKHLREEVELAEMVARRAGQCGCLPPSEEQMNAYFGVERAIASGQALTEVGIQIELCIRHRHVGPRRAPQDSTDEAQVMQVEVPS